MSNEATPLLVVERAQILRFATLANHTALIEEVQLNANQQALVTITFACNCGATACADEQQLCKTVAASALNCLRPLVRKTDEVFLLGNQLHFLLLEARIEGGEIVQDRLWDALLWRIHNSSDREFAHLNSVAIGCSAYPEPHATIDAFLHTACETCFQADLHPQKPPQQPTPQSGATDTPSPAEDDLLARSLRLGIPYLLNLPHMLPERLKRLIDVQLAQELQCYPVGKERKVLTVAMVNPQDHAALHRLRQVTGLTIFPVLTHPDRLQSALQQLL